MARRTVGLEREASWYLNIRISRPVAKTLIRLTNPDRRPSMSISVEPLAERLGIEVGENQAWVCSSGQADVPIFATGSVRNRAGFDAKHDVSMLALPQ